MRKLLLACLIAFTTSLSFAEEAKPIATDPVLEKRVLALTEELRCLVCQNQTIADSHADLAVDLKNQVREKLTQGASDEEVLDYMVQRYGDFVLYRPPVKKTTWVLWFGPFLLLGLGVLFLVVKLRARSKIAAAEPTSESELQRAADLLGSYNDNKENP